MRKLAFITAFALSLGLIFSPVIRGETKKGATNAATPIYKKKTVINFSGEQIEGKLTRPDGEYIEARKRVKLKSLISLRENWKKRIVNAVSDL